MAIRGRQAHQKSRGVSRGKMFLADKLGWLPGYPVTLAADDEKGIEWMAVPREGNRPLASARLTRESLHDATYTWTKLTVHYPRALPVIIPNLDHWRVAVPHLLDLLKETVHDGRPLPDSLLTVPGAYAESTLKKLNESLGDWPEGKCLVDAYSWIGYLHPAELISTYKWISRYRTSFERLLDERPHDGLTLAILTCETARLSDYRPFDMLMTLMEQRSTYRYNFDRPQIHSLLETWTKRLKKPNPNKPAPPPYGPNTRSEQFTAIYAFVESCRRSTHKERQNLLTLSEQIYPLELFKEWERYWNQYERITDEISRYEAWSQQSERNAEATRRTLSGALIELKRTIPKPPDLLTILTNLNMCVTGAYQTLIPDVKLLMKQIPLTLDDQLCRAPLLKEFLPVKKDSHPSVKLEQYIQAFLGYLSRTKDLEDGFRFAPWEDRIEEFNGQGRYRRRFSLYHLLFRLELNKKNVADDLFRILESLLRKLGPPIHRAGLNHLGALYRITQSVDLTEALILQIIPLDSDSEPLYYTDQALELAIELSDSEFEEAFKTYLSIVDGLNYDENNALRRVNDGLKKQGWHQGIRLLIDEGHLKRLIKIGSLMGPAKKLDIEILPKPAISHDPIPVQLTRYPDLLQPALHSLSRVTTPERYLDITHNLLGKTFPDRDALQQEIEFLSQHVEEKPQLAKRLANLRKRLAKPASPSPKKLENLYHKLARSVVLEMLSDWEETVQTQIKEIIQTFLDRKTLDPVFFETEHARLLTFMLTLEKDVQALGKQLILKRNGPRPWHLHDSKQNQEFIKGSVSYGVDLDPWLTPPAAHEVMGDNGQTVILSFADDPLEIFQMGGYFNTCLSPGSFNYFSAIVNAADVNKHIVYARTQKGTVIGRCLICLSESRTIVVYHPYCHDNGLNFRGMIEKLVDQLATDMRTVVMPYGEVPTLMTDEWYDDGPEALSKRFDFLNWHSRFRKKIRENRYKPRAFVDLCRRLFAPLPLNGLTLNLLLNLPELSQRPQLIAALAPIAFEHEGEIPNETWAKIAIGLDHLGMDHEVNQILKTHAVPYLIKQERNRHTDRAIMHLLIKVDPAAALNLIRKTRHKRTRSDADEPKHRIKYLIKIYEALGREKKRRRLTVDG